MNRKCQVFTPTNYVAELLNSVGYTENLYGKKILENSCGDGNILEVVVPAAKGFYAICSGCRNPHKRKLAEDNIEGY